MNIRVLLGCFLILLLVSCAAYLNLERASRTAVARGDYDAAVYYACASLRHKPDNLRAQQLLQDAFRIAVNRRLDRVKELAGSSNKFRWDEIVAEYEALVSLNRAVRDLPTLVNPVLPGGVFTIPTSDYTAALAEAKQRAAEEHYQEGIRLSANPEDVAAQKQAALEFRRAEEFVAGYKDAAARFAASRKAGTTRLAIVPFEDRSGQTAKFGAMVERIADEAISRLLADAAASEFLEVVTRERLEQVMREQNLQFSGLVDPASAVRLGKLLGAHYILTGRLTQVLYVPPRVESRKLELENKVVVRREKRVDSTGTEVEVPIESIVHATVTVFTKNSSLSLAGAYEVINVETAAIARTETVEGKDEYSARWAVYEGDRRAVTGEYGELVQKSEPDSPTEAEMMYNAAARVGQKMAEGLRAFFR